MTKITIKHDGLTKNTDGHNGPICNSCGGFGYTLSFAGGSAGCHDCDQTGIAIPSRSELAQKIQALEKQLGMGISRTTAITRSIKASRQFWVEMITWSTSTATAIANLATETVLVPNTTVPANYLQDGRGLRVIAYGSYGTTSTPTLQFRFRWGGVAGTVMAATGAFTTTSATGGGASMTAQWSLLDAMVQTRSNGSAGTTMTNGTIITHTSTALTAGTVTNYGQVSPLVSGATGGTTPAVATIDATADTAFSFTGQWGTSNAANSIQATNFTIESLN